MLLCEGYKLAGFARLSTSEDYREEPSLAARLIQYCWTHWHDPVDVGRNVL